jgi:hypothetical protein
MIGSKAIVAISLLCALLFCAIGASGASAATSGTTAFTCVSNPEVKGDFEDVHCKTPVVAGTGKFTHKAISTNPTGFTVTNAEAEEATKKAAPAVLKGILGGIGAEIVCKKVHAHGTLENKLSLELHSVAGSGTVDYSECTMTKPLDPNGRERCVVEEPIKFEANGVTKEKGKEMGTLFTPKAGTIFVELEFTQGPGGPCPVAGKKVPVTGSAEATDQSGPEGSSATAEFTNAMTKGEKCETAEQKGICLGGQPAEFSNTITFKMLMTTEGTPENAITVTTPPFTADA